MHQLILVLRKVTKLNDVRDDNTQYNNRLDTTLADVFSLLSLFYLTIGKTRDAPATYCQIASMRVSNPLFILLFRPCFSEGTIYHLPEEDGPAYFYCYSSSIILNALYPTANP